MGDATEYFSNSLLGQRFGGVDNGAASIDLIVKGQGNLALYIADDVHGLVLVVVAGAAFFDDGQGRSQTFRHVAGLFANTDIDGNDYQVLQLFGFKVLAHYGQCGQFVNGDVEETLDLAGVEVHGQKAVGPGGG